MKKLKSAQRILLIGLCFLLFVVSIAVGSYAYFKTDLRVNGYANVKIELLFDMLDETARTEYQEGVESEEKITLTESDKIWGHKGNPYVISAPRHLQNLSTLQNIGYFKAKFLNSNYSADGTLTGDSNYSDGYNIPYFLVSDVKGKPVVIDASTETIKPVGDDKYPFVGSVKGVSGVQTDGTTIYAEMSIKEKKTSTSAIHGVKVEDNSGKLDFGFFGTIGYLGVEPEVTEDDGTEKTFEGQISTVSDLLFSDVQIVVKDSIWEKIVDLLTNHRFYSDLIASNPEKDPHENHHIGIVAGHVEYAQFKNISVYYSSDDIVAIDLLDLAKDTEGNAMNYSSATGIFGFLYNLNPKFEGGSITVGSGLTNTDISYGFEGGGGQESGSMPGYIRADEMYNSYCYYLSADGTTIEQQSGKVEIIKATSADGKQQLATAVTNSANQTMYYYTDGVFTFALSDGQDSSKVDYDKNDTLEDIWETDKVSDFTLSADWKIGQEGEETRYYKNLTRISDLSQISDDKTYYIGRIENNVFYYMDLTTSVSGIATKIDSPQAKGDISVAIDNPEQPVLSYTDKAQRDEDAKYAVKIIKNSSTNTCQISSANNGNLKLGIRKITFIVSGNHIYCGNDTGSDIYYDFSLNTHTADNKAWSFSNETLSSNIRYSNNAFSVAIFSAGTPEPIYIYQIDDDRDDVNTNPYSYVPTNQESAHHLPADQYVLYPQSESSASATKSATPTYTLTSLSDLNWKNQNGQAIWTGESKLTKMFNMKKAVDWSITANIFGFGASIGSQGGIMLAPVGTGAYRKSVYIPTGSLAFYINKVPTNGAKIRVIVKIPQSDQFGTLGFDSNTSGEDYYLGIWKGTVRNNSWIQLASFDKSRAYKKVEMPRSQPKLYNNTIPEHDTTNGSDSDNEYINVTYGNTTYKTYLQGGHYMLAYEFVVEETGVYILAASNSNMQLAYCSVDGIASAGRDGTGGSPWGSVDFVYDNNVDKILLVTDTDQRGEGVEEDCSNYYYGSNCLLYFDNITDSKTTAYINDERITIRRWTKTNSAGGTDAAGNVDSYLSIRVESNADDQNHEYVKCVGYGTPHDNIVGITSKDVEGIEYTNR
ncbi:MAG: hypothetical protein HPZ86_03010 [Clostridia bacterium]|nr:hypothetical protein [Clostridia bacterium]